MSMTLQETLLQGMMGKSIHDQRTPPCRFVFKIQQLVTIKKLGENPLAVKQIHQILA